MKVTTNTPDLLIVEDRPLFIAIALILFTLAFVGAGLAMVSQGELWGLLFVILGGGMGIGFFFLFVRRVQVIFHRPEGYVEFRRKNLWSQFSVRYKLSEIDRVDMDVSRSSDGPNTYRVVLVIEKGESAGRHPITITYSNGSGHQRCKDAIEAWLAA